MKSSLTEPASPDQLPADRATPRAGKRQESKQDGKLSLFRLLLKDRFATVVRLLLVFIGLTRCSAPRSWATWPPSRTSFRQQGALHFAHGWEYFLGSDSLGRSMLARLVVASRTTLSVAVPAVAVALRRRFPLGRVGRLPPRLARERRRCAIADVIMSFPSLLLAVVVLYVFSPSAANIVLILALTRIPIYLRTARAESAELQKPDVRGCGPDLRAPGRTPSSSGTSSRWCCRRCSTLATLEFCYVMLAESSLSFLGIGIQPPDVSWGLMVSQGRQYLQTAWWLSDLSRRRHRGHHHRRQRPRGLAADRHRPCPALAPGTSPQAADRPHSSQGGKAVKTAAQTVPPGQSRAHDVVLAVRDLAVDIRTHRGTVRAVNGVGFEARAGETLALLGESGCGKSMTAKALAGIMDPVCDLAGGEIVLNGTDLAALTPKRTAQVRRTRAGHRLPGRPDRPEPRLYR